MSRYGSREVLTILDIRPHVLRYWEQTLPIIRAGRDDTGHRVWTAAQLRMLQRIRYLVVDRGMSVAAAGDTLLAEAASTPASTKSGLESLREELLRTLSVVRSRGRSSLQGTKDTSETREISFVPQPITLSATAPPERDPLVTGPPVEARDEGELPEDLPQLLRRYDPVSLDRRREVDRGDPTPRVEGHRPASSILPTPPVRVVYRHLYAYREKGAREHEDIPTILRSILEYRLKDEPPGMGGPIVVMAPTDQINTYTKGFADWNTGANTYPSLTVLPVRSVRAGSRRWISPLLGTLYAIRTQREMGTLQAVTENPYAYFWAVGAPDAPISLSDQLLAQTRSVLLFAHVLGDPTDSLHPKRYLLGESFGLDLTVPNILETLLKSGKWSWGPVVQRDDRDADTLTKGWRYDLWIRDMIEIAGSWIGVRRAAVPALWRGEDWSRQVAAVWPTVERAP